MKQLYVLIGLTLVFMAFTSCETDQMTAPENVTTLDQAAFKNSKADKKMTGFDQWGYNWNAHHFNGYLINAVLGDFLFIDYPHYQYPPYKGEGMPYWDELVGYFDYFVYFMPPELLDCKLVMHWNEKLISNEGVYPEKWMDSNGWITFHFMYDKDKEKWSHFRRMVAARSTDYVENGMWYNKDGTELGVATDVWPELIINQVINTGDVPYLFYRTDPYRSPYSPGYGKYKLND